MILCLLVGCERENILDYITDLEQQNIKGPVKKLQTTTIAVDFYGQNSVESVSTEVFDEKGYTIKDERITCRDNSVVRNELKFNDHGALQSIITWINDSISSVSTVLYGKANECIQIITKDATGFLLYRDSLITQNEFGEIASARRYDHDGTLLASYVNRYKGKYLISATERDSKDKTRAKVEIELNENGDPVKELYFEVTNLIQVKKYSYNKIDKHQNWNEQIVRDTNDSIMQINMRAFTYADE